MHIRCPHCRNHNEIVDDRDLSEVICDSCGSSFSLIATDETATYEPDSTKTIGHFTLLEHVGVGAFGNVWKGQDSELDRTVAVKVPRKGQLSKAETEKFLREARAAAQLRHANIVSVHEVGREDDTVYIVSDFVEGLTLRDWLTGQQPTPREAAKLCVKLAAALHHAHEQGVIHRDLKPSNILMDRKQEPYLTDFGLAKREAGEITVTMDGHVLGTPAYMSPEQARGEGHYVDRRADIYSLGVVLFELLTGERPFRGNTRMLIHQLINEEAPSLRKFNASIPKDLETICLRCLEKDPDRRFATAQDFQEELQRWLDGKAILSRPISRLERGWRWCRRKPLSASLIALVCVVTIIGLAGISWQLHLTNLAKVEAQENFTSSEVNRKQREEYYAVALSSVDSMLTRLGSEELSQVKELTDARREILEDALNMYAKMLEQEPENERLRFELACAHDRVGSIHRLLGNQVEAASAFQEAIHRLNSLDEDYPNNPDYLWQLINSHESLGLVASSQKERGEAIQHFQAAVSLYGKVLASDPSSQESYAYRYPVTLGYLAEQYMEENPEKAYQLLSERREQFKKLYDDGREKHPGYFNSVLIRSYGTELDLAVLEHNAGRHVLGLQRERQALAYALERLEKYGERVRYLGSVRLRNSTSGHEWSIHDTIASILRRIAASEERLGNTEAAEAALREASRHERQAKQAEEFESVEKTTATVLQIAKNHQKEGKHIEALRVLLTASEAHKILLEETPSAKLNVILTQLLSTACDSARILEDVERATELSEQLITAADAVPSTDPQVFESTNRKAWHCFHHSAWLRNKNRPSEVIATARLGLEAAVLNHSLSEEQVRWWLGDINGFQDHFISCLGQFPDAATEQDWAYALSQSEAIAVEQPSNFNNLVLLGQLSYRFGKWQQVSDSFQNAADGDFHLSHQDRLIWAAALWELQEHDRVSEVLTPSQAAIVIPILEQGLDALEVIAKVNPLREQAHKLVAESKLKEAIKIYEQFEPFGSEKDEDALFDLYARVLDHQNLKKMIARKNLSVAEWKIPFAYYHMSDSENFRKSRHELLSNVELEHPEYYFHTFCFVAAIAPLEEELHDVVIAMAQSLTENEVTWARTRVARAMYFCGKLEPWVEQLPEASEMRSGHEMLIELNRYRASPTPESRTRLEAMLRTQEGKAMGMIRAGLLPKSWWVATFELAFANELRRVLEMPIITEKDLRNRWDEYHEGKQHGEELVQESQIDDAIDVYEQLQAMAVEDFSGILIDLYARKMQWDKALALTSENSTKLQVQHKRGILLYLTNQRDEYNDLRVEMLCDYEELNENETNHISRFSYLYPIDFELTAAVQTLVDEIASPERPSWTKEFLGPNLLQLDKLSPWYDALPKDSPLRKREKILWLIDQVRATPTSALRDQLQDEADSLESRLKRNEQGGDLGQYWHQYVGQLWRLREAQSALQDLAATETVESVPSDAVDTESK